MFSFLQIEKDDIQIRFFENSKRSVIWEDFGTFSPSRIQEQRGIWFRPPLYRNMDIEDSVRVFIQLRRPSDGSTSEALPFEYLPKQTGRYMKLTRFYF